MSNDRIGAVPTLRRQRTAMFLRPTAVVTLCLVLVVPDTVVGYPVPQQRYSFEQPLSHDVLCVLTIDPVSWKRDAPASVYIQLENRTDRDLDLKIIPELFLRNTQGTYYSLADIVQN